MQIFLYIAAVVALAALVIVVGGLSVIGACLLGGVGFCGIVAWIARS